jgi:hypothetical protein
MRQILGKCVEIENGNVEGVWGSGLLSCSGHSALIPEVGFQDFLYWTEMCRLGVIQPRQIMEIFNRTITVKFELGWRQVLEMLVIMITIINLEKMINYYNPAIISSKLCAPVPKNPDILEAEYVWHWDIVRDYSQRFVLQLEDDDGERLLVEIEKNLCQPDSLAKGCGCWQHLRETYVFIPSDEVFQSHFLVEATYVKSGNILVLDEVDW